MEAFRRLVRSWTSPTAITDGAAIVPCSSTSSGRGAAPASGAAALPPLHFRLQGVALEVVTDDPACRQQIASDFSRFTVTGSELDAPRQRSIRICVWRREPPAGRIPGRRWMRTRDADVYSGGGRRILESPGRCRVVIDFANDCAEIYATDLDLLHEKAYLLIMSRIGAALDGRGLHRIHAMGVEHGGRSIVCMIAMGGGKTTLALGLLEVPGFALLSDEAPLVDRAGRLHAFPIRLGVVAGTALAIPDDFLSSLRRSHHGPKTLIDARYFSDRSVESAEPGILLVGRRIQGNEPRLEPVSRRRAFRTLWEMSVRARGIPELLEYVLRPSPAGLRVLFATYASRIRACWKLVRRSECHAIDLCEDRTANAALVAGLARERFATRIPTGAR